MTYRTLLLTKVFTTKQIYVEEIVSIDHKRRLALCRFQDKKYIILLGQNDLVVDVISEKI